MKSQDFDTSSEFCSVKKTDLVVIKVKAIYKKEVNVTVGLLDFKIFLRESLNEKFY